MLRKREWKYIKFSTKSTKDTKNGKQKWVQSYNNKMKTVANILDISQLC
jgi:hypothetical protein